MEHDEMTQAEFIAYLETLSRLIKAEATTADDAVKIIQDLIERLEKTK